ncbi:MAG: SDR family oxidoreductase, partial [Vicinamibacteria bacterium]
MTTDIQAHFGAGFSSSVRFRVSGAMVDRFAALTGDRSALHVSDAFASRSIYRQPVVHGILPVAFLSLVDGLRIGGLVCRPKTISGRFTNPVYVGDPLSLHVELAKDQPSSSDVAFNYHLAKVASNATVTTGSITLTYRRGNPEPAEWPADDSTMAGLLVGPLPALCLGPDDISKGRSDGFDFEVTERAIGSFVEVLAQGIDGKDSFRRIVSQGAFHYPNLLAITLLSTLVGTRLPGDSATFLEYSARLEKEIEPGKPYRLEGVVTHVSRATRILKAGVSIFGNRDREIDATLQGRVTALVNQPHRIMPTIQDMKTASAPDMGISGKVVLITGASRGIGETIAKLLSLYGARIIVNYHRGKDDADRIVQEIATEGGDAIAVQADVTRLEQVRKMVAEAKDRYGPIGVLVNNAVRDFRAIPFLSLTWDEIQMELDVVAKGAFHCCQEVIPQMLAAGGGKIINISSVAVDNPPPDQAKYVLAKSALVGLTRSLSIEFAPRNIQVNLVVPNFVETDLVAHIPEGFRARIARDTPMQRLGSPLEVAQAVVFLASSFSSFTTGQKIMVTGGG